MSVKIEEENAVVVEIITTVGAIAADEIATSVAIEIIAIAISLIEEIKLVVRGRRGIVLLTQREIAVVPEAVESTVLEVVGGDHGRLLGASLVDSVRRGVEVEALVVAATVHRVAGAIVHRGVAGHLHHCAGGE